MTPDTLYTGSAINATVTVENTGSSQQDYNATVAVDGSVVASKTGSLSAGETTTVSFTKTLWDTGGRDVSVGGLASQTVTVQSANANFHGGPGNLGYYPDQSGPTSTPTELWNISGGTPMVMQPTIVGDTLYFAFHDGGKLYAVDPMTGEEKWNATPGGISGSTWTTPAYANGVLFLGSNDYKLHAINATDGSELWNYSTQTNVRSAPAVVDGVVYFGSNDGNMTALNATTGEELWYYTMHQPVLVESNPAVVDGVVYFGAYDNNVTALNATTGQKLWNYTVIDQIESDATVANNTVFIGSDSTAGTTSGDGKVYALNATDGTERWNYTLTGDVDGSPVYADGTLYAGSRGGDLVALNAADGTKVWNVSGASFRGAPVVAGNVLYISDFGSGTVYAFNTNDGSELWQYDSPVASLYPTPLAWNDILYYGSGSHFYAIKEPAPTVSNVNATNPSGQNVTITFNSSESLFDIAVSLSGPESATLTESDFTETGSGPYTYTATYEGSSDGTYTATVDTAANTKAQDGANGESDSVLVDTTDPTADAGTNQTLYLGSWATLDASSSTDANTVSSYAWNFGDGTTASGAVHNHTYRAVGTYTATVTVTDQSGNTDTDTVVVTVQSANANFHGSLSNLGYYPNETGPTSAPVEAWNISGGTPMVMQPTIVGDTLYFAFHDGGKLYAVDPVTGEEKWNATPGGISGSTWTTPAYANGVLFLGSNDHKLHAINATDGTELWNYSTQTNVRSAPAVVDGVVYFGSNDGNVTALNATTGEELWYYTMHQPVLVESNPAVVDGVVYITGDDDNVTALNATTGQKLWNYTLIDESQSDPTVANNTVFVGSDSTAGETSGDGQVYALNATDGSLRWNYTLTGDVDGSPVYADGTLYAGSRGGDLVALNAADGTKIWNVSGASFRGAPVVASDVLYISDYGNGTVHAFNATDGTELWQYDSPISVLYPTPLAWNGTLYYGSGSHFHALKEPGVSNFAVSNPSSQNVTITFDTHDQIVDISMTLSGAESATLTENDFTEMNNGDGTYTYGASYVGSSDGTYTATLTVANDSSGDNKASGNSDSVVVDTTPPTITNFSATESSGQNVTISFNSSEQLGSTQVSLSGPELTTLSLENFTETGSGPYTYTATYDGSSNGTYTATLDSAMDAFNNDGASSESASASIGTAVVSSSIEYVSGSQPDMSNVTLDAWFSSGLLQLQAKNATANISDFSTEADYELAGLGADSTTVLRTNVTVQGYTPRALIGSAHDVNWTRTQNQNGTWTLSITGTPAEVQSFFYANGSSPSSWPGTIQANESQTAALTFAVDDLGVLSSTHRERLNGSVMVTDAQEFGSPQYNTSGTNDKVELRVKAPHFTTSGANNTGFFEAFLPQQLLDDWGVSANQLAGELNGASRATTITAVSGGGAYVEFDIHYSEGDAAVTVDSIAPTADAGADQTVDEDTTAQFNGTNSTDNVGIDSYEWDFGDGTNATGENVSHTYTEPGSYTVTLNVTDAAGNNDTDTMVVTVEDATDPTAAAGSNQTVDEDTAVQFNGSSSTDNVGVDSYQWSFGDGNSTTGENVSHTYAQPGTYTVTVTATDAAGNSDTDTLVVTVNDTTAPVADAGSNQTVDEDTVVQFNASNSTDNVGVDSYEWNFGDGSNATGENVSHTYTQPGTYTATVETTDAAGHNDTDTLVVTVNDTTDPTADAGTDQTISKNRPVQFNASDSTDNVGIVSYQWDYGDGNSAIGESAAHAYNNPGTYTVTLTTTDAAGNSENDTLVVTVVDPDKNRSGSGSSGSSDSDDDDSESERSDTTAPETDDSNDEPAGESSGTKVSVERKSGSNEEKSESADVKVENVTPGVTVEITFDETADSDTGDRANNTSSTDLENSTATINQTSTGNETASDVGNETANATDRQRPSNISVANMRMNVSRSGDFSLNVTTREVASNSEADGSAQETTAQADSTGPSNTTRGMSDTDRKFLEETGARPAGYVIVDHDDLSDDSIDDVTFTFRVSKAYLDSTRVTADSVALYRNETVRWNKLSTTLVGETETEYVFEAKSPGLSEFVIGATAPTFEVTETALSNDEVVVGDDAIVDVTLSNLGGAAGTHTLELRSDGTTIATETVTLDAGEERTVSLGAAFESAGTYELTVDGESVGKLRIVTEQAEEQAAATTVENPDAPGENNGGSGPLVMLLLLVALAGVSIYVLFGRGGSK
ncbi:PKD domain-containing protein [Haloferax elongans]|uniref:PKD domain-containing protein n=1 Tax=Haloferax elongans TaxID=403191 RepID=UPI001F4D20B1|nr:PKD domain-containing protein [Haloferax elongans]